MSDAPLEKIEASSGKLLGILDPQTNRFAFRIPISSFTGFNSPLQQEHFNENYLESASFENASFEGRIVDSFDYGESGEYHVRAKGAMTIHGKSNEEIIPCVLKIEEKVIYVNSQFHILLFNYNITIPKVVSRKISEEISIEVSAELELR